MKTLKTFMEGIKVHKKNELENMSTKDLKKYSDSILATHHGVNKVLADRQRADRKKRGTGEFSKRRSQERWHEPGRDQDIKNGNW